MSARARLLAAVAGWLFALLALAQTPDQVLFGPNQYERTAAPPDEYSGTFSVPASAGAPFLLRIVNGAANGQNRISSGRVTLNGVQVVGPNDFGQNVALIERTVSLAPNNTIHVRLTSAPGGYITLSVLGTRILPVPTSLTPNPISITAGASGTLTAALSPSPTTPGTLAVTSANTAVATVPASIDFASGQATVLIPVAGIAAGSTSVTASANGGSASAAVNVTPAPPTIATLAPTSLTVTHGSSGTLTVTISATQASDTQVAVSSSNPAVASVPASVSVQAGQLAAAISVEGLSPGDASISASLNGSSASSQVTVNSAPPKVISLVPVLSSIALGGGTSLRLTISAAQSAGIVVPLAVSPAGIVQVPAEATVPAGALTVLVPVSSLAYGQAGITATLNGTASAGINVIPPPAAVTALEPSQLAMTAGATSLFTVRINAAQTTNTEIQLSSSDPAAVQVPASVSIGQGATSATFSASALADGQATITASVNNTEKSATVQIAAQAAAVVSLLPSPLPLQQGATGSLTVTINAAQPTDTGIQLANTMPSVATAPAGVTIPAGAIFAQVAVNAVSPGTAQITASVNGTSAVTSVAVAAPAPVVATLAPAALSLPKGTPSVLRVTLSRAPNIATAVSVSSSDPAVASVPAQVNVAAGELFAELPVMANAVGQATITASLNGGSASSAVSVAPAELVDLTLSPQTPTNYVGEGVPFTATGRMTDGTTEDFTTRVTWTSHNSAVATIAQTGIATLVAAGTTTIAATFTFNAVQTGELGIVTQSTVLTVKVPTPLVLSAPVTTLEVTQSVTVTVSTTDAPPFGGLVVNLSGAGNGAGTFPPSVTIPEYETSTTFQFTATGAGSYTLAANAQNRLQGTLAFSIVPQLRITGFTPQTGPIGTAVAISGSGFDPALSGNQVKFNGEAAVIASGNATLLNVIVPPRATTGPITVTNSRGTASSAAPFTVQDREAFDITLAPAGIQVPPGGHGGARIRLASTGLNPYPYAANIVVSGLPAGVTAALDRPTVALNQDAIVTFSAAAGAPAGGFTATLTINGASGATTRTVTRTLGLQILATGGTTVTGRVIHADDGAPFVGARVRLGGTHVFTDETGTYRFVSPQVAGDQVLLIDGNTNNSPQFEYPSGIAMPVMIVAGQDNRVLTSHIGRVDATRFTTVVPGQAATVTDPDLPNFSLNIQNGQTIIGWDGQPVTRINVRRVSPDRLPIRPIPEGVSTRSVYLFYFFREGGGDPTSPIPVTLPNDTDALPGQQLTLYYYDEQATPDPNSNQWKVMGTGTVTQDGRSIVTDPGVGIPRFCCGAVFTGLPAPSGGLAGDGDGTCSCNPVDLGSGNAMLFRPRPFGMSKLVSLDVNPTYRSTDPGFSMFGPGFSFSHAWFTQWSGGGCVRLPNGTISCSLPTLQVISPQGVPYSFAQFTTSSGTTTFYSGGRSGGMGAEMHFAAGGRTLKLADGTQHEFDSSGRLRASIDPTGNRTIFQTDSFGFILSMIDPAGKAYEFTYSGTGAGRRATRITDPAGRYLEFTYDGGRRLIAYRDQAGGIWQFGYNERGRVNQVTDPRGAVKTIEYDDFNRAVREALPENAEERYEYSGTDRVVAGTRHTDPNGNVTTYRWNPLGYPTEKTDALGGKTRYELTASSQVRRVTDPAGRATQLFYNTRGDLIRTIDADGKETKIDYDARFRKPTRIENALGHVTLMVYNAQAKLTSFTNAENETTTFTYTARGQLETITDPLSRVTRLTYDVNGNLVNGTNTANETVTRIYDAANRMVELADSLNRTARFTYDDADRVTEVRDAANGLTKYAYDANDNLLSVTDPNNNLVERNVYDLRNRLKERTDAKNRTSFFDYDGVGNLIRQTDRKGQVTEYAYDALNRLTRIQDHDGRITTYGYDLASNLTQVADTQSGDVLMTYDALDRLTEVVTPQGTVAYTYDAIGRRTSRTLSGGDVTTYTYDKVDRIKTVTLRGRTASYSYDAAGRLTARVLPNGIKVAYAYDDADRVTSIAYAKTDDTPIETITYTYDGTGQRVSRGDGQVPPKDTTFSASYDEANRLTSITIGGELFTLTYDDNGNLMSKAGAASGTTTYSWSARDQLVALSGPSGSATFKYDAFGRRIEKTVNGQSTGFIYDGRQALAELSGSSIDTVYHAGVMIDEVLARYAMSGNRALLSDALMSVIAQANDDQSIANFYAYSPYGEVLALGVDDGNSLRYTGREDDGTGLYYYRARYYDPILKRFISQDPIGLEGGANFYAYVANSPTTFTDPLGSLVVPAPPVAPPVGGPSGNPGGPGKGGDNPFNPSSGKSPSGASGSGSGSGSGTGSGGGGDDCKAKCKKRFDERETYCWALYGGSTPAGVLFGLYLACQAANVAIYKACISSCDCK